MNKTLLFFALVILIFACKKQDEEGVQDNISYAPQTATSEVGEQSSAAEGATSPFTQVNDLGDAISGMDFVDQFTGCTFSSVRSACSGAVITLSWGGCTVAAGKIAMTGGWTETFNSPTACSNFSAGNGLTTNNDWIARTTTGSVATFLLGTTLTTDTNAGTAWDGTTMNANGVKVTRTSATARTINMDSVHRVLAGPLGTKWFDHYTTGNLSVSGTRAAGNRIVSNGTINVYHNLAKYTAANSFSNVSWGSALCCYPTGGSITTSMTGSVTHSIVVDFSPGATTCGNATYTVDGGGSQSITLTQCM